MIKFLHPNPNRCKRVNKDFFKFPLFYLPKFRNNKVYKFLNFPVFDVIVQEVNGQKISTLSLCNSLILNFDFEVCFFKFDLTLTHN